MTISSLVHKELLDDKSIVNVLWIPSENKILDNYLHNNNKLNIIQCDSSYFAMHDIDIVVCNNRISSLDKSIDLALYYHCPLIIIDHLEKPHYINSMQNDYIFEPVYQIAVSESISASWQIEYDKIIDYTNYKDIIDIILSLSSKFIKLKLYIEPKSSENED